MSPPDMAKTFAKWNEGILSSYLIEITSKILDKKDDVTGEGYVVDYVSLNLFAKLNCLIRKIGKKLKRIK